MKKDELAAIADYVMPALPEGRADLGLLFGTRHGVDEFCAAAHALWRRGMFTKLLVSGGATAGQAEPEADVIAGRLVGWGCRRKRCYSKRPPPTPAKTSSSRAAWPKRRSAKTASRACS
jgi:hypothetical protein